MINFFLKVLSTIADGFTVINYMDDLSVGQVPFICMLIAVIGIMLYKKVRNNEELKAKKAEPSGHKSCNYTINIYNYFK